jgi:hypothetical protein
VFCVAAQARGGWSANFAIHIALLPSMRVVADIGLDIRGVQIFMCRRFTSGILLKEGFC